MFANWRLIGGVFAKSVFADWRLTGGILFNPAGKAEKRSRFVRIMSAGAWVCELNDGQRLLKRVKKAPRSHGGEPAHSEGGFGGYEFGGYGQF